MPRCQLAGNNNNKKKTFPKIHIFCHTGEIFMNPLVWDKCYTLSTSITMEDADSIKKERNSIWGNWASLVAQLVKNLPAVEETRVQSLGWEDPLEKEMATIPVSLPGKSHGQRSLVGCSPWGRKESGRTEQLTINTWDKTALIHLLSSSNNVQSKRRFLIDPEHKSNCLLLGYWM